MTSDRLCYMSEFKPLFTGGDFPVRLIYDIVTKKLFDVGGKESIPEVIFHSAVYHFIGIQMWCVLPKTDTFGQEIKIELVIDNESRDLQLYNDSFRF